MAWYLVFRFQKTDASLRKVKLTMSSHFSNLGGFTLPTNDCGWVNFSCLETKKIHPTFPLSTRNSPNSNDQLGGKVCSLCSNVGDVGAGFEEALPVAARFGARHPDALLRLIRL